MWRVVSRWRTPSGRTLRAHPFMVALRSRRPRLRSPLEDEDLLPPAPAHWQVDLRHRMPAPTRVALDLEGSPVGLSSEVNPALPEQRRLPPADGTGVGGTGTTGLVEPDGWGHGQRPPLAPYTSTAFIFIRPMLSQP